MSKFIASIEAWGINNPDPTIFNLEDTGREYGHCVSETCFHYSHDPRGPVMRLSLKDGEGMQYMGSHAQEGRDDRDPADQVSFYSLPDGRYLRVCKPFHFNESACVVDWLPDFEKMNQEHERRHEIVDISFTEHDPLTREEREAVIVSERAEREMRAPRQPRPPRVMGPRPVRPPRG